MVHRSAAVMNCILLIFMSLAGCSRLGFNVYSQTDGSLAEADVDETPDASSSEGGADVLLDTDVDAVVELEPLQLSQAIALSSIHANNPSIVFNGTGYGLSYHDAGSGVGTDIFFVSLDSNGNINGAPVTVGPAEEISREPSLVWTGNRYGIAWKDLRDLDKAEIYFAILDENGIQQGEEIRVTTNQSESQYPSIVWSSGEFFIAFLDGQSGEEAIYLARIDPNGVTPTVSVSQVTNSAHASSSMSLWGDENRLALAWSERREENNIFFAFMNRDGEFTAPEIQVSSTSGSSTDPVLAATDEGFVVAFQDRSSGNHEIYLTWLDSTGGPSSPALQLSDDLCTSVRPSIAVGADRAVVGWWDNDSGGCFDVHYAEVIIGSDTVLSTQLLSDGVNVASDVSVAWSGSQFTFAWEDERDVDVSDILCLRQLR